MRKSVFNLCSSRGWALIGIEAVGTDLESVFIRLVDRADGVTEGGKKKKRR